MPITRAQIRNIAAHMYTMRNPYGLFSEDEREVFEETAPKQDHRSFTDEDRAIFERTMDDMGIEEGELVGLSIEEIENIQAFFKVLDGTFIEQDYETEHPNKLSRIAQQRAAGETHSAKFPSPRRIAQNIFDRMAISGTDESIKEQMQEIAKTFADLGGNQYLDHFSQNVIHPRQTAELAEALAEYLPNPGVSDADHLTNAQAAVILAYNHHNETAYSTIHDLSLTEDNYGQEDYNPDAITPEAIAAVKAAMIQGEGGLEQALYNARNPGVDCGDGQLVNAGFIEKYGIMGIGRHASFISGATKDWLERLNAAETGLSPARLRDIFDSAAAEQTRALQNIYGILEDGLPGPDTVAALEMYEALNALEDLTPETAVELVEGVDKNGEVCHMTRQQHTLLQVEQAQRALDKTAFKTETDSEALRGKIRELGAELTKDQEAGLMDKRGPELQNSIHAQLPKGLET